MSDDRFLVLIVEEDRGLCLDLSATLLDAGCQVQCLRTGEANYQAIRQLAPDLVILDISMPESAGLDTLRRLEVHRSTKKIPVIATSRQAELEYELLDAFDFLPKPIDRRRLLEDVALLKANRHEHGLGYSPMNEEELALFQDYLLTHSGLHFDQSNIKILERGLQRRMRAIGAKDYVAYFHYLDRYGENRQEQKKLLGLLTVGETYFFRYLAHFDALIHHVLPELIVRNRTRRSLRIWSAGCSTGEEPYTLAMLLCEHFPLLADWDVQILGTDINKVALRRAHEGSYGPRALRVTDAVFREKYFQRVGSAYVVDTRIRDMVRFAYLNLQTGAFPSADNGTGEVDILFCRNVMIYFRLGTTRRIVEKFSRCLSPGSFLFLGHAETLINISDRFQRQHQAGGFYYQLRDARTADKPPALPCLPPPVATFRPPPRSPQPSLPVPPPACPLPADVPSTPDLQELFVRAEQEFNRENFRTASQGYDTILRHMPRHVGAMVGKGFILANEGFYEQALDVCTQALAVDDLRPEVYFLRGLICELQNDLEGAVSEYRKALLLDMEFIMPHYNLSKVFWRLGRPRDARRELNNTVRLLEKTADEAIIPHSGGLSRAVFLEVCRDDAGQLGKQP
ncbi:MAG TPA: CheR family methyltransferase [Desulfuromonadales bacterium]|nr:CheR family methyltransferase [Desulfuromonadales bacterium]